MNYDSYLARAIEIFNDKMDADFSRDNVILTCFMTDDQEEIFEQFCAQYFPYRLHDRYQEDGMINAGYAVWRECIAEIIAIECDDNCDIFPIRDKKKMLAQLRDEINQLDGKLLVSEILTAVMTSAEVEASQTWDEAEKAIHSLKLFDTAPEMDLMRLVFNQLQDRLIEIDVDFISELGFLYLNILSLSLLRNFQMP